jgi:tetratricopeptide (TPR) repeat protein
MKKIIFPLIVLLILFSTFISGSVFPATKADETHPATIADGVHPTTIADEAHPTTTADVVQDLKVKLETWDVAQIWPVVQDALAKNPQDPDLLDTAAQIAFHRGDYPESLNLMNESLEAGGENEQRRGFALFIEQTINVLASYKRYETPHFIITLDEERDGILAGYVTDTLEDTYRIMAQNYGFKPDEKVRVEIFPDARSFYLASALSVRDIEVTGAVGLTKFNKVQLLSPRALVQGYRWLDAISHEYMHYLIVKQTSNKAPIWFHEGLAKYEETRWRNGPTYLSPLYQTLLARAQEEKRLIGFEKMEPSLIYLDTPEDVQLAYAQAASAIEFIVQGIGYEGLKRIMGRMALSKSEGAAESIQEVMGINFGEFERKWTAYLAAKDLKPVAGVSVHHHKVREGEIDMDRMALEEIKSLVARNRTHLGDKLKERGRLEAAVIQYRRALEQTDDAVPIRNRLSSALTSLGRHDEALDILKRTLELAPDNPTSYTQLGRLYLLKKNFEGAKEAFEESIQINPFDPDIHVGISNAYAMLGDTIDSTKERDVALLLMRR